MPQQTHRKRSRRRRHRWDPQGTIDLQQQVRISKARRGWGEKTGAANSQPPPARSWSTVVTFILVPRLESTPVASEICPSTNKAVTHQLDLHAAQERFLRRAYVQTGLVHSRRGISDPDVKELHGARTISRRPSEKKDESRATHDSFWWRPSSRRERPDQRIDGVRRGAV
jgi:hypothetical protein